MTDLETVLLIDCWEDRNALDRHHASLMMEKIMQLWEKYDLHMEVERYVSDGDGIPESDGQFIRKQDCAKSKKFMSICVGEYYKYGRT